MIAFGWYVVHKLSARRDIDKARRELTAKTADQIVDSLNQLLKSALAYHCAQHSVQNATAIKMAIQDIAQQVAALADICSDRRLIMTSQERIVLLRQTITGHHFDDEHDAPLGEDDRLLQNMASAFLDTKRAILELKYGQFPATS